MSANNCNYPFFAKYLDDATFLEAIEHAKSCSHCSRILLNTEAYLVQPQNMLKNHEDENYILEKNLKDAALAINMELSQKEYTPQKLPSYLAELHSTSALDTIIVSIKNGIRLITRHLENLSFPAGNELSVATRSSVSENAVVFERNIPNCGLTAFQMIRSGEREVDLQLQLPADSNISKLYLKKGERLLKASPISGNHAAFTRLTPDTYRIEFQSTSSSLPGYTDISIVNE